MQPNGQVGWNFSLTYNAALGIARTKEMIGFSQGGITVIGNKDIPLSIFGDMTVEEENNIANENASYNGVANLRAVLKIANIEQYYNLISIVIVLAVSFFIFKKKVLNNYSKESFLILNNLNLLIFYHAIYDFIFLIPLLAYTIVQKLNFKQKFVFYSTIIYFFYFIKINRAILNNLLNEDIINIIGFSILVYSSLLLYRIKNYL
jgi:hypothetical protein